MPNQKTLRQNPLFSDWNEKDFEKLFEMTSMKLLSAGEILFNEGELADTFYVLLSGTISIKKATPTGEEAVTTFGPGTTFGELSMLHKGGLEEKRSATAQAIEATQLVEFPILTFEKLLETSASASVSFYKNLAVQLAARIRRTTEDLAGIRALRLRHL
jgi:CRP-like cAMP-binding protein